MVKIREAIVVEGKYDQNTLRQIVDTAVIPTRGFGVLKDRALLDFLRAVEGMEPAVLLEALRRAGATFVEEAAARPGGQPITKADLYDLGLSGGPGSREKRLALLKRLGLPAHMSANALLEALNLLYTREAFLQEFQP